MQDIRLDFIGDISIEMKEEISIIRSLFINLDNRIKSYEDKPGYALSSSARTIAIARTNLETALQYIIKSLCLMGEKK